MGKLIISSFKSCIKKYMAVLLSVMAATLFIICADSIYSSYCTVELKNAYSYNGKWDFRLSGDKFLTEEIEGLTLTGTTENHYTAVLDKIAKEDIQEPESTFTENYLLSLVGIDETSSVCVTDRPEKGRLPEKAGEIMVPDTFVYEGRYMEPGDTITVPVIERRTEEGEITQEDTVDKYETRSTPVSTEYTICGIYTDHNDTYGTYVKNAYIWKSGTDCHTCYYVLDNRDYDSYLEMDRYLRINNYSEDAGNEYVRGALYSVYNSDYFRAAKNGIKAFQAIIILVSLSVIMLNLFQTAESERMKIRQLYTLGAERLRIAGLYLTMFSITELAGIIFGISVSAGLLTVLKSFLIKLLNSGYSDFSLILIRPVRLIILYAVIVLATGLMLYLKVSRMLTGRKQPRIDRTINKASQNILGIAGQNIRNRFVFNTALTISVTFVLLMGTIVLGLHPGMKEKSNESSKLLESQGDYYLDGDKRANQYSEYLKSITGVEKLCKSSGCDVNIVIPTKSDDKSEYFANIMSPNEETYSKYRRINPDMVSYEEFCKGEAVYITDEYHLTATDTIERTTNLQPGDKISFIYYTGNIQPKELTITGVIHTRTENIYDNDKHIMIIANENPNFSDCPLEQYSTSYRIYCSQDKKKEAGEQIKQFARLKNLFFQDTVKEYSLAEDNYSIQVFVIAIVAGLFILIGAAGIITAVRLDELSRKKEFRIYRTLGMGELTAGIMQYAEYLSVLLSALLLSILIIIIASNTIMKRMMQYYSVDMKRFIKMLLLSTIVMAVFLLITAVIVTLSRYRKQKRLHD